MKTYINDILVEYATEHLEDVSFSTTEESVQNAKSVDITKHVRKNLQEFTISCAFTGDDRADKFKKLLLLAEKRDLVTFKQEDEIKNLIIIHISQPGKFDNVITFDIVFKQLALTDLKSLKVPLPEKKSVIAKKKTKGTQKTTNKNIKPIKYPPK